MSWGEEGGREGDEIRDPISRFAKAESRWSSEGKGWACEWGGVGRLTSSGRVLDTT